MNAHDLEERMDHLERIVEPLRELPDRVAKVELQIVQLRAEMGDEFSAIRRHMVTKQDLVGFATKEDLVGFATKEELVQAVAPLATKDEMRMLHEHLVQRLKVIGEGQARRRPRR